MSSVINFRLTKVVTQLSLVFSVLFLASCSVTRNIPLTMDMQVNAPSYPKVNKTVTVVMSEEQVQQKIIYQPNALHDYFTFAAGQAIKANLMNVLSHRFGNVIFASEINDAKATSTDYIVTTNLTDHKVNMTLADWTVAMDICYTFSNASNKTLITIDTKGDSSNLKSGTAKALTVIAPAVDFIGGGIQKDNRRLGVGFDKALAESLSQFVNELDTHLNRH